ncbi:T9SS type A sorting domain-containing protein [Hymenobacter rubripertinctus]|uniref:Secretion system C-terminal sorting domain-containing protein n=1 Tax=Hymenobacter rubripertinctus TaxID=2029981 RepID=A0A418QKG9_9BACT|nr:T9SS type A sorting domain-containing protein [Hymenobacter rubripertinctus]RIY05631.1 hypothetical protein D0T11_20150 [Hymenobacter rubripertinctus]
MLLLRGWLLCGLLLLAGPLLAQRLPRALMPPGSRSGVDGPLRRPGAAFLPRQAVRYGWNATSATWINPIREQRTYDAAGQLTRLISSDSVTATPLERQLYTYDAQGNLLETLVQTGNGQPWLNAFRYLRRFDAQSQLTEYHSQAWTGTDWQTTDGFRYLNAYVGAVLTEQIVQVFAADTFSNDTRFEYTLSNEQWAAALTQRWTGTGWENEERVVDLRWHDWPTRRPAGFRVQAWLNPGQWIDFQRYALTYAAGGSVVEVVEEAVGGGWQNFRRYTEPVDAQGNDLGYRQEDWLTGAWVLTNELRAQLRYDSQIRLIRRTEQLYFPLLAQFVNRERSNYSDFQAVITGSRPRLPAPVLLCYPNPATAQLHLELHSLSPQEAVTIEIRNLIGQVVLTSLGRLHHGTLRATLAVAALAPGQYWLLVHTRSGPAVSRFQHQ